MFLWSLLRLDGLSISFVEAICVGATLSATDPVTILAIFNTYKVDPKLYTVIFGESILNDAVAIVMFETAQQFHGHANIGSFFKGIGIFFIVFFASLLIGVFVGVSTALVLKHTYIRRFPRIESCLVLLVAYAAYFFSNGCHLSGKSPRRWKLMALQLTRWEHKALSPCYSVGLPLSTTPTTTCPGVRSLPQSTCFRYLPSFQRISSSFTLDYPSLPTMTSASSLSLSSSPPSPSVSLDGQPYSLSRS